MLEALVIVLFVAVETEAIPLPENEFPSSKTLNFLKQFGYVAAGPDADTIFTKEGFLEVVKQMQTFGGLPATGELDAETLKLITARRCGVPDVIRHASNRTKRYIIGSEAWRKKTITYFLANWPPELEPELTFAKLKKAFEMWSDITPLKFVHENSMNADIIIAFGQSAHGDGYPFDGPGSILAHAFFPYEHGSYGGDVHFDVDEHWIDGETKDGDVELEEGVDFFTVAIHELGHSLGLAHSTVPGSIMFPYYKGYIRNMRLDYDDIVAMYDMYVVRGKFEDDSLPHSENDEEIEVAVTTTQPDETITNESENYDTAINTTTTESGLGETNNDTSDTYDVNDSDATNGDPTENDDHFRKDSAENDVKDDDSTSEKTKPKRKVPDICNGSVDAMAFLRGELFVFKDLFVWRMLTPGIVANGYPTYFHVFFHGFPWTVRQIDAVYQNPDDYNIIFFTGPQYWIFDGNKFTANSPKPLTDLGIASDIQKVDAALVWAKNRRIYLFSNDVYWRLDEHHQKTEAQYPKRIRRWKGIPQGLDAAFTWSDGQTYFFKGNNFWRFNNQNISTDADFPLPIAPYWFNCSHYT